MFLTGGVDKRTLEKYEREAKEQNRESWYLSWAMDTNDEERAKGKTVECGRASFATDKKMFSIIDAPGHKSYVPNMIGGAVQADVAVLVISSRTGEFEAGFDRGGQTREHALLAKSAGVKKLVVVINKMDCDNWNVERYNHCKDSLLPYLKKMGFNPKTDLHFMPIAGQTGEGLKDRVDPVKCPWYDGPSFIEYLDEMPPIKRDLDLPMRLAIADKYSDMGAVAMGKVTAGIVRKGDKLLIMPDRKEVIVASIMHDDEEVEQASSGDNVKVKLKNCEEPDVVPGFVLCMLGHPCSVATVFDCLLQIFEYKSIICAGFTCIMHIHTTAEEMNIKGLIAFVDKKTGKPDKKAGRPRFLKSGEKAIVRIVTDRPVCIETFKESPSMGRFTLRDEMLTIAFGKVLKIVK